MSLTEHWLMHSTSDVVGTAKMFALSSDVPPPLIFKVLSDIKAVQMLLRLNRCHPKKRDTFILDFVDNAERVQEAFQKYYSATILSEETDPNRLNDLLAKIDEYAIFTDQEVDEIL